MDLATIPYSRLDVGNELARQLGCRLIGDTGAQVANVEVDGVAEEQDLQQRDPDNHAEGKAITG